MLVNFDVEKLNGLLFDFYKLSGLTVSIFDSEYNQLAFQPQDKIADFCKIIKSTEEGVIRCHKSDKNLCEECKKIDKAVTHRCHAGLVDTAVPITYNGEVLGFMLFGQIRDDKYATVSFDEIKKLCKGLYTDEKEFEEAYKKVSFVDPSLISSATNILKAVTRFLYLADLIKIQNNELATAIDKYISENLQSKFSVSKLCKEFCVSKNKLYALSDRWFGMTINQYIIYKRIEASKRLFVTTDMAVYEVADAVGIDDYNYFSKLFKKMVGKSPLQYRKTSVKIK